MEAALGQSGLLLELRQHLGEIFGIDRLNKLHRMADAHKEMIAIAIALGISQDEFQRIFDDDLQKL